MPQPPPCPAAERLATLLMVVSQAVAKRTGWALNLQLIALIAARLQTIKRRFQSLAARIAAGTYAPRPRSAAPRERQATQPDPAQRRPAPRDPLPRTFGWLRPLIEETPQFAGLLHIVFQDPEMAALMQAAPAPMGRLLRPLCQMLGVPPPPVIALPQRRRRVRPKPPAPPPMPRWPHDPRPRTRLGFHKGPPPPLGMAGFRGPQRRKPP